MSYSVTSRIAMVSQPRGEYVKLSDMELIDAGGGMIPLDGENVHASIVGLSVDYLTRVATGTDVISAFTASLIGAENAEYMCESGANVVAFAKEMLKLLPEPGNIAGDIGVKAACALCSLDRYYRSGWYGGDPLDVPVPDALTRGHIIDMVGRGVEFFSEYGPITRTGITFEGGYTGTISTGDADFITADTLWDMKVSKSKPTAKNILQVLTYYVMGINSKHDDLKSISRVGIYNPRLNTAYIKKICEIHQEVLDVIADEVVAYGRRRLRNQYMTPRAFLTAAGYLNRALSSDDEAL